MLHLLAQTPLDPAFFERIEGGSVLLLEAAVWSVSAGHVNRDRWLALVERGCRLYALQEHLQAQGVEAQQLLPVVSVIDFAGFVDLAVANEVIRSWY